MKGVLDKVFLIFFASHIPISMLMDAQAILPEERVPEVLKVGLKGWTEVSGDALMRNPPVWFKALVAGELLLQLPFFGVAVYAFMRKCDWIRMPAIIYATHTCTTLIPILGTCGERYA